MKDENADTGSDILEKEPRSVLSDKAVQEMSTAK